jgi:hypothetical protein
LEWDRVKGVTIRGERLIPSHEMRVAQSLLFGYVEGSYETFSHFLSRSCGDGVCHREHQRM